MKKKRAKKKVEKKIGNKKNVRRVMGIFLFILGIFFIVNSFQSTGYSISDQIGKPMSSGFGIILILIGGTLFLARVPKNYDPQIGNLYTKLATRGAYGHHTENMGSLIKYLSQRGVTPKVAEDLIAQEVRKGRLNDVKGTSVSIMMDKGSLEGIIKSHGRQMSTEAVKRIKDLVDKGQMEGVR